jgi:uncharacterized protein YndB with AHSA1/START domain
MTDEPPPTAHVQMLIRRPAAEVYEAFVAPSVTTKFWFTQSSGRLQVGQTVRWAWEMYGAATDVTVKALAPGRRIVISWSGDDDNQVAWQFSPRGAEATLVTIANTGFKGTPGEVLRQAVDATGGFAFVLAGAKAWLEHGIDLRLVVDHNPDGLAAGWRER